MVRIHRLLALSFPTIVNSLSSPISIESLRTANANVLPRLREIAPSESGDEIFLLRFCLSENPEQALQEAMKWRTSDAGMEICSSAKAAVEEATQENGWKDNDKVFASAPHAEVIGQYITPENCITTTNAKGELVYCIRAGSIDDKGLMANVSIEQLVEFFLYVKEVNSRVANLRSDDTLQMVITCNDLAGVKLVGGSADFRKALSESSKIANTVYPNIAGPTLLLNLPKLLSALVKLFTPLFPDAVKQRLKFVQGPLKDVQDLRLIGSSSKAPERTQFLSQLEEVLSS